MSLSIKTVVLSSLYRVFPEVDPSDGQKVSFSCMKNEPLSFQVAFKMEKQGSLPFNLKIDTDLPISLYSEGAVPVLQTFEAKLNDRFRAGIFYDMLLPKTVNPKLTKGGNPWNEYTFDGDKTQLHAMGDSWNAVWLTLNEAEKPVTAGKHNIKLQFLSRSSNELVGECELTVEVIDAKLPKQKLIYTNWFHCDCLCDTYGVEMFSERFWEIFRSFATAAAKNGMNMILTPCFTPPLDTPIGGERMTAQLVGVEVVDGKYRFDFSLLQRWIDEAKKCGITYFEHSHFFTQWGAKHAPKVMATVNGKYKRIFGWETKASGKKYTEFLHAYIPELLNFLKSQNLDKKFLYHVSDEPFPSMKDDYKKATDIVSDLLKGYMRGDALSHYEFYTEGIVQTPIVATNYIHDFKGKCKNLWAYYTGGQCGDGMSNRKLNCSPWRNRMLGLSLYSYNVKGFLQWGYNFYYDMLSHGVSDPKCNPCHYSGANSATAYMVYPATNGECIQSIRQKVFYDGMNDIRALQLLQSKIGRKATLEFLAEHYGNVDFNTDAESEEKFISFREALNRKIGENKTVIGNDVGVVPYNK